jgi:hypothetical protein
MQKVKAVESKAVLKNRQLLKKIYDEFLWG